MSKHFAGLIGAISAFILGAPESFRDAAAVALYFIILDTITGFITAVILRQTSSRNMRNKLVSKCLQYALLIGLAAGAAVLAHTWMFVTAAIWGVIAIEAVSMLESLVNLQSQGVNLGPAAGIIQQISKFFATNPAIEHQLAFRPAEIVEAKDGNSNTPVT